MEKGLIRASSPEEMGLSSAAFLGFFERQRDLGIHSLAAVRNGKAYAVSSRPWRDDAPHTLFSLSKSFTSMAAGIAADERLISFEDSIAEVLSDSLPKKADPKLRQVKLRHLLSMSSGLDPVSDQRSLRGKQNWAREILGFQVLHEPGTVFHYNTMGTYLAGRMVAKRTGMSLRDYLIPRLFEPLGIRKPQWDCCPLGYNTAGFGLHLSVMDIARAAQLLLNRGVWDGKRLLSEAYLSQATKTQIDNRSSESGEDPSDWEQGYGWQFWQARHGRYRGDGMFGQVMMIDDRNNLALAVTAGLNDMGLEMDALHELMDGLLRLPASSPKERGQLKKLSGELACPEPPDDGGALFGEGSYLTSDRKTLRLETPDEDTLRVFYRGRGEFLPFAYTMKRGQAHRGELFVLTPGERPQAYLGRFGVRGGVITAQTVMPEAPYRMWMEIRKTGRGLSVRMDSVGSDSGTFDFIPAK